MNKTKGWRPNFTAASLALGCLFFAACGRPHSVVLRIPAQADLIGTVLIDGAAQAVEYHAPTNITLTGKKIVVRLEQKKSAGDCTINYFAAEWETPGRFPPEMTNQTMKINAQQRYFHLLSTASPGGVKQNAQATSASNPFGVTGLP